MAPDAGFVEMITAGVPDVLDADDLAVLCLDPAAAKDGAEGARADG
jgi:hypothetical protein